MRCCEPCWPDRDCHTEPLQSVRYGGVCTPPLLPLPLCYHKKILLSLVWLKGGCYFVLFWDRRPHQTCFFPPAGQGKDSSVGVPTVLVFDVVSLYLLHQIAHRLCAGGICLKSYHIHTTVYTPFVVKVHCSREGFLYFKSTFWCHLSTHPYHPYPHRAKRLQKRSLVSSLWQRHTKVLTSCMKCSPSSQHRSHTHKNDKTTSSN